MADAIRAKIVRTYTHKRMLSHMLRRSRHFLKVVQFLADKGARIEIWNQKNKYGLTPLMIAEGHRPGNFKPSAETIAALQRVVLSAGESPPNQSAPSVGAGPNYQADEAKKRAP